MPLCGLQNGTSGGHLLSRLAGLLSLNFDAAATDEQAVRDLATLHQHPDFGPALVERHDALTIAVNATPASDESAAERCRAMDGERQLVVYVDGLLFNGAELDRELRANGSPARGPASAQIILAAYAAWGESCFTRLSGSFTFVLLRRAARQVPARARPAGHEDHQLFHCRSTARVFIRDQAAPGAEAPDSCQPACLARVQHARRRAAP